jgi:hypothetical protein
VKYLADGATAVDLQMNALPYFQVRLVITFQA